MHIAAIVATAALAAAILLIGFRFLLVPDAAATAYGVPATRPPT